MKPTTSITHGFAAKILTITLMSLISSAYSATTDIASAPLANASASVVKPNLMFILDDSGSMGRDYMPDYVGGETVCKDYDNTLRDCEIGDPARHASGVNGVYYNPEITYAPPLLYDGTSMPSYTTNAQWQAVPKDGYGIQSTTVTDITADFPDYVWCQDSSPPSADRTAGSVGGECQYALNGTGGWEFPRDGNSDTRVSVSGTTGPYYYTNSNSPIDWCDNFKTTEPDRGTGIGTNPPVSGADSCSFTKDLTNPFDASKTFQYPRYGTWTRVDITPATGTYPRTGTRSDCAGIVGPNGCSYAEEMTNFAHWYAYYQTRMQSMKTAAGHAFRPVDDTYRVGFITINPGSPVSSSQYLSIADFDATQKQAWYNKFYAQNTGSGTPLRQALSRVGRYFANATSGINSGMSDDPMQYSCQQNFSILSSDGNWTTSGGNGVQVDGTTSIGNQDGNATTAPRPMLDANNISNTLADVSQYYYINDLRAAGSIGALGTDVGTDNNVPAQSATDVQNDSNTKQHMTTFTVGLGVNGTLSYKADYRENATGDFLAIKNGSLNWPTPTSGAATTIDDLWHAAVNGRGKYFNAKDPSTLTAGLSEALVGVAATGGAAAAAATSNLEPIAGDNFVYIANYQTVFWNGDVEARTIDLSTGAVGATPVWSAQAQLDAKAASSIPGGNARKIVFFKPGVTNNLEDFFGNGPQMDATELSWFQSPWISADPAPVTSNPNPPLSQWASVPLTAGQKATASAKNLVRFLRGDGTFEKEASNLTISNHIFRGRTSVLGDIVNAQPVYVKTVNASYVDVGYATYKTCMNAGTGVGCSGTPRTPNVYVAANDGMLHAFHGDTGDERWAFIPRILMPRLYRLADQGYSANGGHEYFVDGSPTVADVYDPVAAKWKTILVGGLNSGGRGYYALDVTDPVNPIGLWEFKVRDAASCPSVTVLGADKDDCDLGLSYGNPIISKLGNGEWVVMVASGYNNVSPGDGKGYLYILDPITGIIKKKIKAANATQLLDPGNTTTPLGLAKITNWVDNTNVNNTTLRVYGGDLLGNVWRFDADAGTAYALAQLTDAGATPQPITTKPELGETGGKAMVLVATGQYLGTTDLTSTQTQTIYGIKDVTVGVAPNPPIDARGGTVVAQVLTDTVDGLGNQIRNVTGNAVDLVTKDGWRVDLPLTGERVNVDPKLQLGTLIVASNIPANNACTAGGTSYLNFLDFATGSYIASSGGTLAGYKIANSLAVGISIVRLPNGKTVAIVTTSENKHPTLAPPFQAQPPQGRRNSYREVSE